MTDQELQNVSEEDEYVHVIEKYVHVIEKSAYDKLKAENAKLREALEYEIGRVKARCTAEWCYGLIDGNCACIEKIQNVLKEDW